MNGFLFVIGILGFVVGLLLTQAGAKGSMRASTHFGDFRGEVGSVVLGIGLVLQTISVRL